MIKKIVLTGGPCGGKTTSIQRIEQEFTEKGLKVIVVPEAATTLIGMGIKPFGLNGVSMFDFEKSVIALQLELERIAYENAKMSEKNTLIVCDRGIIDDKAYVTETEFEALMKEFNLNEYDIKRTYDLVIHLRTCAFEKEAVYTLDNNNARTETKEQAREKDEQTWRSWVSHNNHKIIGNETDFEEKMNRVITEIYGLLERYRPTRKEHKFLVNSFDLRNLDSSKIVKLEIEQYLIQDGDIDRMYRKTTRGNETKCKIISKKDTMIENERITTEKMITEREYLEHLSPSITPIRKTRYCFDYENTYLKLDVFEDGLTILEIEETERSKEIVIPEFISVSADISNNPEYKNASIYNKLNKKGPILVRRLHED